MATTYSLAPVPKWYIADLVGKPLGSGYMATFSSLDQSTIKLVYQDPAGTLAWPYVTIPNVGDLGILFDENGSQGPFYFQFNNATPDDLYYLEVYDANGVLQWTIDDFSPSAAGGGSIITNTTNLNNQLINNTMWRNAYQNTPPFTASAPGVFKVIAPGAHAGLSNNVANASGLYTGPDIVFIKSNNNATDTLSFPLFNLGANTLSSDVTPLGYLNYTCSNVGAGGETQKCIQFPVVRNVQNFSNQAVTISFWARSTGITSTLLVQWFPFYGDGSGASSSTPMPIELFNLSNTWTRYTKTTSVPSAVGKTLGGCNNDALFLQFQYPLSALCNIDFIKPTLYLGNVAPTVDFQTNDLIESTINTPRTGQVKVSYDLITPFSMYGWIPMNDGTIGNTSSGATILASSDTFPLFNLLYQNTSNSDVPVSGGRTGNAVNDFIANKTMTIPKALGRAMAASGTGSGLTPRTLGQSLGVDAYFLINSDLPQHTHNSPESPAGAYVQSGDPAENIFQPGGVGHTSGITGGITGWNSQTAVSLFQPTTYMNYFIKL